MIHQNHWDQGNAGNAEWVSHDGQCTGTFERTRSVSYHASPLNTVVGIQSSCDCDLGIHKGFENLELIDVARLQKSFRGDVFAILDDWRGKLAL